MKGVREQDKMTSTIPRGRRSSVINNNRAKKVERTGGHRPELPGQRECVLVKKDEHASPSCAADGIQNASALPPHSKIKLQLYPVDEKTRIGLEKDGIHPYLELTLRPTKRISSVLKHINNKWSSSKIASGEPILVPYNMYGDISCCRTWTVKDSDTHAADVYASIGRPATFRLRYGWVPPPELNTSEEPSTSTLNNVCLQSNEALKDCSSNIKNPYEDEREGTQVGQPAAPWIDDLSNISIGALLSEASIQATLKNDAPRSMENDTDLLPAQNSYSKSMVPPWADCLTDSSIGGLLSEVLLQGNFHNGNNAKSIEGNAESLSTQIFSDSLDAFLSARTRCPQGLRPSSHDSQTFMLDGEETCHAFPVQKFSSSGKRVSAITGSSGVCSQDSGSKSFKFLKIEKINTQAGVLKDQACQDSQTDLFISPRTCNDENSLGLANIKWSDSLGPFDLGLSASRKLTREEPTSNSISRFIK